MTCSYAERQDSLERFLRGAFMHMSHRGRGGHRHGGHRGHGRWGDFPFGPGFGGPPFGRGRKARRGDVRAEIVERSDGAWRPSPGSVYPALAQLEDEGLVRTSESEGRRVFELTDEGRAYVEERREELGAPWEAFSRDFSDESKELAGLIKDVAIAAAQVLRAGDDRQAAQAAKVLSDAKRELYLVLAEEEADQA